MDILYQVNTKNVWKTIIRLKNMLKKIDIVFIICFWLKVSFKVNSITFKKDSNFSIKLKNCYPIKFSHIYIEQSIMFLWLVSSIHK